MDRNSSVGLRLIANNAFQSVVELARTRSVSGISASVGRRIQVVLKFFVAKPFFQRVAVAPPTEEGMVKGGGERGR